MDILVRNIDPKFVATIDKRCQELTNKTGEKWSRLMNYKIDQFDLLLEKFIDIQTKNTETLNDYVHTNNQIIETLIGGI